LLAQGAAQGRFSCRNGAKIAQQIKAQTLLPPSVDIVGSLHQLDGILTTFRRSHFHGDEKFRPRALLCFDDVTTMSVALSNGASVVAFIGLSGEALRGILFIYDIVEDIKDVPGHLRALYQDLTFFQLSLAAFQETTTNAARLGPLLGLSTTQVLDDAANAIKPILVVFQEYGLGRATPFRKRIRVALKKQKLLKYSERLVKSSSLIIATNANISM
jgi:hypothetical protein